MPPISFPALKKIKILSLGAESVGRFCFYDGGNVFISQDFGDILDENNLKIYKKSVLACIKTDKPDVILTDLHPLYNSTVLGEELSKKLKVPCIKVQHHLAHIFSAIGDRLLHDTEYSMPNTIFGIAMDGTGYGFDGKIWGGEVFQIQRSKFKDQNDNSESEENKLQHYQISRFGSLEEQTMIGGDLAVKEPARMLIAILAKITKSKYQNTNKSQNPNTKTQKNFIYKYVNRFYTRNEFELLYNQMGQGFNCQATTSAGRILDAVSLFLGFAENERKSKHEATRLLEKNSSMPYIDYELRIADCESRKILDTTSLFEYLLRNICRDKKRLAATAQLYLAKGLHRILESIQDAKYKTPDTFLAGGLSNNRIISSFLENKGAYVSKTIPRGDEGLAFGQILYYLLHEMNIPPA